MHMKFKYSAFAALFIAIMLAIPAFAAETPKSAHAPALADLHKAKGVGCDACHDVQKQKKITVDDSENAVSMKCASCHGSLADLGAKSKEEVNPHKSHFGEMNCTVCHHGHEASKAYCLNCHSFEMKIPGGDALAAAKTTSKLVPSHAKAASKVAPKTVAKADEADVVVVGSGAAGLTAAITAHDLGAKVIVLEKQPVSGGNSMLAAGGMNAADTGFQKQKGIKDSPELMYKDTMTGGQNLNDPALVKILADNSAASIDWLTSIGADVSDVGRMGGASVARTHRPKGGGAVGAEVTGTLKRNAAKRNVDVRLNSKVVRLLQAKDGHVYGVEVEGKHRGLYTIRAKTVVLASGGFSANANKVAFYRPEFKGMTTSNQPGATGDGVDMGTAIGAATRDMKQIQIHPTIAAGSRILISESVRGNGAILVNHAGRRFVNELTTRDKASAAILAQPGQSAYLVFDDKVRKSLKQIEGYFHLGLVIEGATSDELAAKLKVPPATLAATLESYQKAFDAKNDAEFHRPEMPQRIDTPHFYAIEVKPGVHYTMGGLTINTSSQVLSEKGQPIAGLYATGEVSGGVHGANRLGGNSISQTITFGRIAGQKAAEAAGAKK